MGVDIAPDQVWVGKGNGAKQKIRILRIAVNRNVTFERIEGSPAHALGKEQRASQANVEAAFEYSGETMGTFL